MLFPYVPMNDHRKDMYLWILSPVSTNAALSTVSRQADTSVAIQTAVLKQIADSQQQVAELLADLGIGQNVDIQA